MAKDNAEYNYVVNLLRPFSNYPLNSLTASYINKLPALSKWMILC